MGDYPYLRLAQPSGAEASAETIDDSSAALQATLSSWELGLFFLTVETAAPRARFSQVGSRMKTADPLLVSFGISDHDAGELLAPPASSAPSPSWWSLIRSSLRRPSPLTGISTSPGL